MTTKHKKEDGSEKKEGLGSNGHKAQRPERRGGGGREHFPFHLSYTYLVFPVTNLVKSQIWPHKELAKSPF
jgi:hypothetical protein